MGEGGTTPPASAVDGPSVLCAACWKLVLLFGLSCVFVLRWLRHRGQPGVADARRESDVVSIPEDKSLTGHTGPRLRRSLQSDTVFQLRPVAAEMDLNAAAPADPQPDSFFTWDSGGSSRDYSFVHTAVELPKYPDGSISEEERQMLLLYMQSGHPELLLNAANVMDPHALLGPTSSADALMCDQATTRGYLETIVEENSDDLRSPSDCDDASVGWGSWDESDDDRVTVVEMETDQNNHGLSDRECVTDAELGRHMPHSGFDLADGSKLEAGNPLDGPRTADRKSVELPGAASGNNCAIMKSDTTAAVEHSVVVDSSLQGSSNMDTQLEVGLNSKINSDFESLWISASNADSVSNAKAWDNSELPQLPVPVFVQHLNFNCNDVNEPPVENSLLELSTDNLCLVPCNAPESAEKLTFSDDFKDYFLPAEHCVPSFDATGHSDDFRDVLAAGNTTPNPETKFFRIGFEPEAREARDDPSSDDNPNPLGAENKNSENMDPQEETVFSPPEGDVLYGSSWLRGPAVKKPEKSTPPEETPFPTRHSDSPPADNSRKALHLSDQSASDDELPHVSNSLSRWQHHNDLQHVQEAISPITRWQHETNLHRKGNVDRFCKQTESDEDTDDGLPPQLREIYSSFKMKDKKMGRIRIKEDKNNNFKKVGLWDNESKVTLPPFVVNNTPLSASSTAHRKDTIREEELDDLELDMFSVDKSHLKPESQSNDTDIADALDSFNHLDEYSSNSEEENSESENSYTVNTVTNIDFENEDLSEASTPDMPSLKNDAPDSYTNESSKLESENTCSDNSDNCPLCTDPSFDHSKINDIFSEISEQRSVNTDVQSLLLNTFPKMTKLQEDTTSTESNGVDSSTPQTSSDSDEGLQKAVKKRVKRRIKDSACAELKHDDSGYVEDDEDDDEDSLEEEKRLKDPIHVLPNVPAGKDLSAKPRKSLSSAFYESRSVTESTKQQKEQIPKTYEEFSEQLERTALAEDVKDVGPKNTKWNIPENLSQFSAWLLEKELKKINTRDEMEKLIVNDIMSLREQTITQFLKNSSVDDKTGIFLPEKPKNSFEPPLENGGTHIGEKLNGDIKVAEKIEKQWTSSSGETVDKTDDLDSAYCDVSFPNKDLQTTNCAQNKDSDELRNSEQQLNNYDDLLKAEQDLYHKPDSEDGSKQNAAKGEESSSGITGTTPDPNAETSETTEFSLSNVYDAGSGKEVKVSCTTSSVASFSEPAAADNTEGSELEERSLSRRIHSEENNLVVSPSLDDNLKHDSRNPVSEEILDNNYVQRVGELCLVDATTEKVSEEVSSILDEHDKVCRFEEPNITTEIITYEKTQHVSENISNENSFDNSTENSGNLESMCIDKVILSVDNDKNANHVNSEVAPSTNAVSYYDPVAPGNEIDLMISASKGVYEITSPEATAVSKEVDTHVIREVLHAYEECVTRPVVNDSANTLPTHAALSDNLSAKAVIVNEETEELRAQTETGPFKDEDLREERRIFAPPDLLDNFSEEEDNSLREESEKNDTACEPVCAEGVNLEYCGRQSSNLYKSKSVTVLQADNYDDDDDDKESDKLDFATSSYDNEQLYLSKSTGGLNTVLTNDNSSDLSSTQDDLCFKPSKDDREEYQRSQSVGRERRQTSPFETWTGQSKSTPDLSRCHEQQLTSSVPLSALLSKSVSQRIQDYLGKSSRGDVLSRSLPPNERSRHYRRICVSTETVVERAARFEARSKPGSRCHDPGLDSRSGSCPPSSMRTHDGLKNGKIYSKPTATVRPTFGINRTTNDYDMKMENGVHKTEEELFELITGYNKASKVTHKPPPGPPAPTPQQSIKSFRLKGKIASARKEFFERLSQQDLTNKSGSNHNKQAHGVDTDDDQCGLKRFSEFRKSAREERARLAQSHPDLGALEAAVRSSRRRIDQLKKRRQKAPTLDAGQPSGNAAAMPGTTASKTKDGTLVLPYRRCTGEIAWASCAKRLQEAKSRTAGSTCKEPLEIVDVRPFKRPAETAPVRAQGGYGHAADDEDEDYPAPASISGSEFTRARSMDFLLDNRERAEPPENRLAQRVKSEHELRIERSLQNLTLPDWYTQSKKPKEGFILRRGSEGSAGESRKRWLGFSSSRTPSTTSLTTPPASYSQRSIVIPKRVTPTVSGEWRCVGSLVSSRESLLTPASPASLSPRECSSAAFHYGLNSSLSRWSSSRLSTSSAPLTALSVHRSFRQPYLGWRAAASSSGGASRSSPGVSPINATTPLQGSRPESPRRGSQDHQYGYGLQQNQITSAATLRPDGNEPADSGSRISPLALYDNTTNVFFNSDMDVPPEPFSTPELRRDRYSYTQSLYSGTVIVSPDTEYKPVPSIAEDSTTADNRFSMCKSPQPPPRIWMESSFVGSKKDQVQYPQGRTIRIVPSDSVRPGDPNRAGESSVRSTCAPQTAMGEYVLRDFRRFGITL